MYKNFGYTSLNVKSFEIFAFNTKLPDVSDMAIQRILHGTAATTEF